MEWEHITGSGKTALEVGMDQTFNSQQSSPKLDDASAIKFLELNALKSQQSLFSRGNSSTQQWEHFFTSSGKIALAVGTILHYQWELLLAVGTHHWKWENCTRSGNGLDI
nr:hypothetical protein [Tanacetum cinerariifolium]